MRNYSVLDMERRSKEFMAIVPGSPIGANVIDNNLNMAIKTWKRTLKSSGVLAEVHGNRFYEKPSITRRKELKDARYQHLKEKRREQQREEEKSTYTIII